MRRPHPKPDAEGQRTGAAGKRANRVVARALVILLAIPLGFLVTAPSLAAPTEAAWQRSVMTGGQVTAGTVPAATLTRECTTTSVAGILPTVRIFWEAPVGYGPANAELHATTSRTSQSLQHQTTFNVATNTAPETGERRYVTTVNTGLLNGILNGPAEPRLAIVIKESGWPSKPATVSFNPGRVLGIGTNCKNITAP